MGLEILTNYSFIVVALGTLVLGGATAVVGCVSILKGQSLIGDAIGHSSFPGIVLAFMLFLTREPNILVLGALLSGAFAYMLIMIITNNTKVGGDTALAITLSSMFGLGMVLKSHIQGNVDYRSASQSGLEHYIFGQAAYLRESDITLIAIVSCVAIVLVLLFFKELKLYVFNPEFAKTIGIKTGAISTIIIIASMILIAVGLKVVGAILISCMLIAPGVAALQWSATFWKVMLIAGITGAVSAVVGTYWSSIGGGIATGPAIAVVMCSIALISLLISPRGILATYFKRKKRRAEAEL